MSPPSRVIAWHRFSTAVSHAGIAVLTAIVVPFAGAAPGRATSSLQTEAVVAVAKDGLSQARLTLMPEARLRLSPSWSAEGRLRLEGAASDTGLGTRDTYDDLSKPWTAAGDDLRLEIEAATLSWRRRSTQITLGKQSVAWGVLDGVQVTDRFDAVRRREAIFTQTRPERLTRWGARARFRIGDTRVDFATAVDGSVNQLALPGDAFDVRAARSRGGLPASIVPAAVAVDVPGDATFGLRASRTVGSSDASILVFQGPDTEPVFRGDGPGVVLDYPTRTLVGANWQRAAGARVWRLEAAWIPQQALNLAPEPDLRVGRESRIILGGGLDWNLPGDLFLNAQLAVDHVDAPSSTLVRPDTDVVSTLRLQRSFRNERWLTAVEMINVLSDGSGTLRPMITWARGDTLALDLGADLIWGDERDLLGQFENASRVYLRIRKSL